MRDRLIKLAGESDRDVLYTYVAPDAVDDVLVNGLHGGKALLTHPKQLARAALARGQSNEAFAAEIKERLRSKFHHASRGPNAVFHQIPANQPLSPKHPVKRHKLEAIAINLGLLLHDKPDTKLYGLELHPHATSGNHLRHRYMRMHEVEDIKDKTPEQYWSTYNDIENKGQYAPDVPHVAIHTASGSVAGKYLSRVAKEKKSSVLAHIEGPSGAGKTTLLEKLKAAHPGLVVKDMDDFAIEASNKVSGGTRTKQQLTDEKKQAKTLRPQLMAEFIKQHDADQVVLAGNNVHPRSDAAMPNGPVPAEAEKLLLDVGPITATFRRWKRNRLLPENNDWGAKWEWDKVKKYYDAAKQTRRVALARGYTPMNAEQIHSTISGKVKKAHITLLTGQMGAGKTTLSDKLKDRYDVVHHTDLGSVDKTTGEYTTPTGEAKQRATKQRIEQILRDHRAGKRVLVDGYPHSVVGRYSAILPHVQHVLHLEHGAVKQLLAVVKRSTERGSSPISDVRYAINDRKSGDEAIRTIVDTVGKHNTTRIGRDYADKTKK